MRFFHVTYARFKKVTFRRKLFFEIVVKYSWRIKVPNVDIVYSNL